jgi:hypothetical protein
LIELLRIASPFSPAVHQHSNANADRIILCEVAEGAVLVVFVSLREHPGLKAHCATRGLAKYGVIDKPSLPAIEQDLRSGIVILVVFSTSA